MFGVYLQKKLNRFNTRIIEYGVLEFTRYSEYLIKMIGSRNETQETVFDVKVSLYDDMFQVLITSLKSTSEIGNHSHI